MSNADQEFTSTLAEIGVSVTRTDSTTFTETVNEVITPPAIGVPFRELEEVSLENTVVETELTPRRLREAQTGVTLVEQAIAEYGSLLVRSDHEGTEPVSLYPPTHVAVVRENDIIPDVEASVEQLDVIFDSGGSAVFATGASSTGDMGALVEGVHGPKHVHVVVLEER